jgi:hypothetical protein
VRYLLADVDRPMETVELTAGVVEGATASVMVFGFAVEIVL